MNISFDTVSNQIKTVVEQKSESFFYTQQKKILAIAILIFSGIVLYHLIKSYGFKAKVISPQPPFVRTSPIVLHGSPRPMPKNFEWIKEAEDAENFMHKVQDISTITKVALRVLPIYWKYPDLHVHIGNIIEHASLDQVDFIVIALAQNNKVVLLRNVFNYLFQQIKKDPDSKIHKEKMEAVLRALTHDQLMNLLFINDRYPQYGSDELYIRQEREISEIPLADFLQWREEFEFPEEFIEGCKKLLNYAQCIKPEVKKFVDKHGGICA